MAITRSQASSTAVRSLLLSLLGLLPFLFGSQQVAAQDSEAEAIANIRQLLTSTQQGMEIGRIVASPVSGLYEVEIQNGQTIFVSADARYLIPGDLYRADPEGLVNMGEVRRSELRMERMAALDEKDMIIYPAKGESRAELTVFTDVDCPYCRRLHGEIDELNALGITVRYLAFPRTGLDTETHHKMVSIWCASDRKAMFTASKRGAEVPAADCPNPVAQQYYLGREVGVTGTPALVFDDGTILPGYVPAATIAEYLISGE
jgi:thiol:disulfide interchange protein DsbC